MPIRPHLRLAIIFAADPLIAALEELAFAFKSKAVEFGDVLKIGRTQLQDAVPMTLVRSSTPICHPFKEDIARIREAAALFREVNLGATAIGTGINADPVTPRWRSRNWRAPRTSPWCRQQSDRGDLRHGRFRAVLSGVLSGSPSSCRRSATHLRLLSSARVRVLGKFASDRARISIMPGKVNPVIPEVVNQVALHGDRSYSLVTHVRRRRPTSAQCV